MSSKSPKPEPVVVTTICSLCEQPWEDHGETPSTADCIRLLKQELLKRAQTVIYRDRWPTWWQYPSVYDTPLKDNTWHPSPTYPTITYSSNPSTATSGYLALDANVVEFRRPDDDDGPDPVPAVP